MSTDSTVSALRQERDSLGVISVPAACYWGAQTERSLLHFRVGTERMPIALIRAMALIKKAAALLHGRWGDLPADKVRWIVQAADEVIDGALDDHFPLLVWQTGSGTQSHMNVNEVISNRAIELAGGVKGSKTPIHPNDDVNRSQSSNDVFPSAMHIAAVLEIKRELLPHLRLLQEGLERKASVYAETIKIGRTHLMDAVPMTLGQEFSGYASQIAHGREAIEYAMIHLSELALGGTAVGTGLHADPRFGSAMAELLAEWTGHPFISAPNKFEAIAAHDAIVEMSGALKRVACSLCKIANDVRLLASGPRAGFSELLLPENEPGSSIMPGKVNPTQCEAMAMVVAQVIGNDAAIAFAGAQGHLELNTFKPVMIYNLLQSIRLLGDVAAQFNTQCLVGLRPNEAQLQRYVEHSLMLATALTPILGYDKTAQVVQKAHREGITLKEAVLSMQLLSSERFDALVDPRAMALI